MSASQKAKNKCCKCNHLWEDFPGASATIHACPKCGSVYWKWLNYNK